MKLSTESAYCVDVKELRQIHQGHVVMQFGSNSSLGAFAGPCFCEFRQLFAGKAYRVG
jgi:hypothetical protein